MVTPSLCCIRKAPACRLDIRVAAGVLLALAHDENWTSGGRARMRTIGAIVLAKPVKTSTLGGLGRAGPVCRRAFARFKEIMAVRTSFLLDILRDLSERGGGQSRNFFVRQGLPAVSGSPSCPRLQVPDPGLIQPPAQTGKTVLGPRAPRPVRTSRTRCGVRPRPGGRISAVLSCRRL